MCEAAEERHEWRDVVVGEMLVVDHVEETAFDEVHEVLDFEDERAAVVEQVARPQRDLGEAVGVGEDVVGGDQCRCAVLLADQRRQLAAKEGRQGGDATGRRLGRDLLRRVHAEHAAAHLLLELAEERAVVAADVDDEVVIGDRAVVSSTREPYLLKCSTKLGLVPLT
jgi:hypothetical protein